MVPISELLTAGRVAVSAHKGGHEGVRSATWEAYQQALTSGAEYVEFDIRRTRDGEFVVYHDERIHHDGPLLTEISYAELCTGVGYPVPKVRDVMELIAGRMLGHLDLKEVGGEREVISMAVEILGAENFVATTLEDVTIAAIKREFPHVITALSLGRGMNELIWFARLPTRLRELFPLRRIRACGADWVAVNHRLARLGVLWQCARHNTPVMVWTVNKDPLLARFLGDRRVAVLITDFPRRALAIRDAR
jgi:glycerophosphoryl diester phosphodiesterase